MWKKVNAPLEAASLLAAVAILFSAIIVVRGEVADAAVEHEVWERYIIDLNSADERLLLLLPGIGPVLARTIVEWKKENGGFRCAKDLQKVRGIGPRRADAIMRHAVLGPGGGPGRSVRRQGVERPPGRACGRGADCRPGLEGGSGDG